MSKTTKLAVGVLALILLGGGIFYASQDTNDPYEGWETYRNEELGFSFRYPAGFILEKPLEVENPENREPSTTMFGDVKLEHVYIKDKEESSGIRISFLVFPNLDSLSPDEWMDEKGLRPFSLDENDIVKEVKVDDVSAIWEESVSPNEDFSFIVGVFQKEGNMVEIMTTIRSRNEREWSLAQGRTTLTMFLNSIRFD